ncbi:alpha/beta hydrolase [Paenibacillus sp. 1A_MP2]|uniref:alpha/beta hydrolase n=1 Tax=Paenibacillus sp. 1A_MP2 TaxID=3457495 RepID=UPI003FCD9FD5
MADHEGAPIAELLNRAGISAFVLKYRVAPHQHPAPMTDGQRAIRYVRAHAEQFGIQPSKIAVLGFSAGGTLQPRWELCMTRVNQIMKILLNGRVHARIGLFFVIR